MRYWQKFFAAALPAIVCFIDCNFAQADPVNMQVRAIGDAGAGGVGYAYGMATYDVTNSQYAAFLNNVASSDPYGLYNPSMASDLNTAGINQVGVSGSYSYTVIPGAENKPVTYVSWLDAARMANWMDNGQLSGGETAATTETGAYTLNGLLSGSRPMTNPGSSYYIPSVAEWRKAAFYDPTHGGLWLYSPRTNTVPGNQIGSLPDQMNIQVSSSYSVTQSTATSPTQNYLTDVGAYTASASYYGTYDQGGLAWNPTTDIQGSNTSIIQNLGGSWGNSEQYARNNQQGFAFINSEFSSYGIRLATSAAIASPVPEPSTFALLGGGILCALGYRWRCRR